SDLKETFQIAMAVPVHDADGLSRRNAEAGERRCQAADPLPELTVGQPFVVSVNDFLIGHLRQPGPEQVSDQQRIAIGRWGVKNRFPGHCASSHLGLLTAVNPFGCRPWRPSEASSR